MLTTRTPETFARCSNSTLTHLEPNIGLQNSITGSVVSAKLLVVEYVTRSFPWKAFSGSQNERWRWPAQSRSIASWVADGPGVESEEDMTRSVVLC